MLMSERYAPRDGGGRMVRRRFVGGTELQSTVKRQRVGRPKTRYETLAEIQEFLGVGRSTMYRYMDLGMPYEDFGGSRKFWRPEVVKWVRARSARIKAGDECGVAWLEDAS